MYISGSNPKYYSGVMYLNDSQKCQKHLCFASLFSSKTICMNKTAFPCQQFGNSICLEKGENKHVIRFRLNFHEIKV